MLAVLAASSLSYTTLSSEEFHEKLYDGFFAAVLDVRWESEWDGGHIVNATHMPGLQDYPDGTVPSQLLGCTTCNIVLYCYSGMRSKAAAEKLSALGFTGGLYDGLGITQWQGAGYPLESTPSRDPACASPETKTCAWQLTDATPSFPPGVPDNHPQRPPPPPFPPRAPSRPPAYPRHMAAPLSRWVTIGVPVGVALCLVLVVAPLVAWRVWRARHAAARRKAPLPPGL